MRSLALLLCLVGGAVAGEDEKEGEELPSLCLAGRQWSEASESIEEGRVAAGAASGMAVTLHPSFRPIVAAYRGCYARIVSRSRKGFRWDNAAWALRLDRPVDEAPGAVFHLRLGVFCADGNSAAWTLLVRVSKPNTDRPHFDQDSFVFYIPRTARPAPEGHPPLLVGHVRVYDKDPVIYNAKLSLRLAGPARRYFRLETDGRLGLVRPLEGPVELAAEVCDYGSPQLCASAPIRVVPVAVTPPLEVRVEASTELYQIVSWKRPEFGSPEAYVLTIDVREGLETSGQSVEVEAAAEEGERQWGVARFRLDRARAYFVRVEAVAGDERTPSEPIRLPEVLRRIHCSSRCAPGGQPMCFWAGARSKQMWVGEEPQCLCHPGFTGHLCREKEECGGALAASPVGPTVWPTTRVNATAFAHCPYGPRRVRLSRRCHIDPDSHRPAWDLVDMTHSSQCIKKSGLLTKLALDSLVSLENFPLTAARLRAFAAKLEDVLFAAYADNQVARTIVGLVGEVMNQNLAFLKPAEEEEIRARYADILNTYAEEVVVEGRRESHGPPDGVLTETLDVSVAVYAVGAPAPPAHSDRSREEPPPQPVRHVRQGLSVRLGDGLGLRPQRLSVIALRNGLFYPTKSGRGPIEPVLEVRLPHSPRLYAPALLAYNITPVHPPKDWNTTAKNYSCVYYDAEEREWSTAGVETVRGRPSEAVHCVSEHLTGFSIIFDLHAGRELGAADRERLNALSWLGCGLSLLGLAATMLTYGLFRPLRKDRAGKVLLSLCLALAALNVSFILSSLRPYVRFGRGTCMGIAAALHYSTLATLLWMGVEAANMHAMLVRVFGSAAGCFLLKRSLLGWGLPAVVVSLVASVEPSAYYSQGDAYCRLSARSSPVAHYAASLIPALVILTGNSIVFVLILRALFGPAREAVRKNSTSSSGAAGGLGGEGKTRALAVQVRGAVTVMALLGVTWVVGMLAFGPGKVFFVYVFAVLNSAQGLVIFLTRCLLHPLARECWARLAKGKGLGSPRSSGSSPSSNSTTTRSAIVKADTRSSSSSPVLTRTRVVTFRDPKEPLLDRNSHGRLPDEPALHNGGGLSAQRSPLVRLRASVARRWPSLSLSSWKFVDDPPSPLKAAPSPALLSFAQRVPPPEPRLSLHRFDDPEI